MDQKFYIETYGCRVNQCESQAIKEGWRKAGFILVNEPEKADYIIVNSCAITARAERNARNALNRLRKLAPAAAIILTGCAAQFYTDFNPRKNAPWTAPDICINQEEKGKLLSGPDLSGPREFFPALYASSRARPVVKVQDGCTQRCAYCIVPQTRGVPRSLPPEAIWKQCRTLAEQGYGELVISGINLRQYAGNFWVMLRELEEKLAGESAGDVRLRLSSIDPAMLTDEAVDVLGQSRMLCRHLHLSLQHAAPDILDRMGRKHYRLENISSTLQKLREFWPVMGLGADFILGFPGETEADVEFLLDSISRLPLTYAHVFPYSRRQGTRAAGMPGQLPGKEKESRTELIRQAIAKKQQAFLENQLELPLVHMAFERQAGGYWYGVNEFYTQCAMPRKGCSSSQALVPGRPAEIRGGKLILAAKGM